MGIFSTARPFVVISYAGQYSEKEHSAVPQMSDTLRSAGRCTASSGEHRHIGYAYGSNGWITSGAAMSFGASKDYFMQIQGGGSKNKDVLLYARYIYEGIYSDWKTIAFTDSNVASATKLQTARTIWGKSFDGSGNVSGNLEMVVSKVYWNDDASNYFITINKCMIFSY